jgi:hypothetical protein
MRKDHALLVLHAFDDWKGYTERDFKHLKNDGRRRLKKPDVCRFCPAGAAP